MKTLNISSCNSGYIIRCVIILTLVVISQHVQSSSPDSIFITQPSFANTCANNNFTAAFNNTGTFGVRIKTYFIIQSTPVDTILPACPAGGAGTVAGKIQINGAANCIVTPLGTDEWSITDTSATGTAIIYYSIFVDCSILNDSALHNNFFSNGFVANNIELNQSWIDTVSNTPIDLYDAITLNR